MGAKVSVSSDASNLCNRQFNCSAQRGLYTISNRLPEVISSGTLPVTLTKLIVEFFLGSMDVAESNHYEKH